MAKTETKPELTVQDVVASACDGVFDAATQRDRADAALRATPGLHDAVWAEGVRSFVNAFRHQQRTAVRANACPRGAEAIRVASQAAERSYTEGFVFDDGCCLGDRLGGDIAPYAARHEALAGGHAAVAKFLRSVAEKVPARGKVRNYLTEEQLRELARKAGMTHG